MSSVASSCTSSGSRPRGHVAKKSSERLEDNDEHRGEENQHRKFVEPAEPDVALAVTPRSEIAQQHPAPEVVAREQGAERHFYVQPTARSSEPAEPEPNAKDERQDAARGHDAPIELALHQLEALAGHRIVRQGVIHEQPRQVEQAREPRDHENDVQRLDPKHQAENRRLRYGHLLRSPTMA